MLDWCAGRDTCARCDPLVVGLKLEAKLVIEDTQIAVVAAHYRRRQDCLNFLRHHADVGLVVAIVAKAVEAKAVIEVTKE